MSNFTAGEGFSIDLRMDEASLQRLAAFADYEAMLDPALYKAMESSISLIQAFATDYMWAHFRHPTGILEESWEVEIAARESILTNTSAYGRRRNYGFSNMTDALGRYYAHDWGIGWAEITLVSVQYRVEERFQAAIDYANLQLGRGPI